MKKFARATLLCFIPIVTGVVCFIVGNTMGNTTVIYAGMLTLVAGLPAMMVVFLIVGLILMSMGKLGDGEKAGSDTAAEPDDTAPPTDEAGDGAAKEEKISQRERERNRIDAVNAAHGFQSRVNMGKYEMQSVAEGMKHAPKWGVAVGLTAFFLLFADLIVATVLLINGIYVGAIVCAALLAFVLITTFTVMTVSRARAMRDDISKAEKITEGTVKACFAIGTTTMKTGGNRRRYGNRKTVRIRDVTYRVIVRADGGEYGAFSKRFYETDEKVTIAVMGKKRAKIVQDAPENSEAE